MNLQSYYAVIFTSMKSDDIEGYAEMAQQMEELAKQQPGFLGFETAEGKLNISISYWQSLQHIQQWKHHSEHQLAQRYGKRSWYSYYKVRVCKIEREYEFGDLPGQ